ncbi:MAG: alginate lyase family protein, partial [Acidobacteriota bacterium]|nr:alginate lyase family protein [Acidobacteriota bacterium]
TFAARYRIKSIPEADRILAGGMPYFSHYWVDGFRGGEDWYRNPIVGGSVDPKIHWQDQSFISSEFGDLKVIIDPSRFGWVFTLIRAYRLTGDRRYYERCRTLVLDWADHARPTGGPLWICGQETAIRAMALYFLWHSCPKDEEGKGFQSVLSHLLMVHGKRIEGSLAYALSQKNNHGITEATALYSIGAMFPDDPRGHRWHRIGRRNLIGELTSQIYDDGAYVQHSVNYHRLMLQTAIWALTLGESLGKAFPDAVYEKIGKAADWLYAMVDPETGRAPNYGNNDGAWIFPLDSMGYSDYRAGVQAAYHLCHQRPAYPPGPWDEPLYWFAPGEPRVSGEPESREESAVVHFPKGGNIVMNAPGGRLIARCADFRDRPGQADQLHVDLWYRGHAIAVDAGTYCYNVTDEWANGLSRSDVHNTITLDDRDQMRRATRFTWINWARGQVTHNDALPDGSHLLTMNHDGYMSMDRGAVHHRAVLRLDATGDSWAVIDQLSPKKQHAVRLHWLFPDYPHEWSAEENRLRLTTPAGEYYVSVASSTGNTADLVRADETSRRGWWAPYYGTKEPALSLGLTAHTNRPVMVTLFSPTPTGIQLQDDGLTLQLGARQARINLDFFKS